METSTSDKPQVRTVRPLGRRLVLELVALAVLAGVGATFPRDVDAGTAWGFLVRHWNSVGHAVLGTVILVEALVFLIRTGRQATPSIRVLAVIGLACVALSLASGIGYLTLHQPDTALTLKTIGWLGAVTAYSTVWVRSRNKKEPRS